MYWIINILGDLDIVGEVLGGALSTGGVGRLHAVALVSFHIPLLILPEKAYILTLIPSTPCRRRTCRTA